MTHDIWDDFGTIFTFISNQITGDNNNPYWVGAAIRQQYKKNWAKKFLNHSGMSQSAKKVIRSDFDQETADKIAPVLIVRLDLVDWT